MKIITNIKNVHAITLCSSDEKILKCIPRQSSKTPKHITNIVVIMVDNVLDHLSSSFSTATITSNKDIEDVRKL